MVAETLPAFPPAMPPGPAGAPYLRVKDFLKQGLAEGRWTPDALMPSEADLVAQFQVSRMTVGRAIRELQAEGLVTRVQGVGTFAAHLHHVASSLTIQDLHEQIQARGHRHDVQVVFVRKEKMPAALAEQLGLPKGSMAFHSLLVHRENSVPLQVEDRWVNPAAAPDYLGVDFTQTTPTHYLLQVAPLWEASYRIDACHPTPLEAELLRIAPTDPCLVMTRHTVNRDMPITLARLVHPGARYHLQGAFKP